MSFILLISAIVLCLIGGLETDTVIMVFLIPALLHLITLKKHGFAYVLIPVDSILVTYGLVYADIELAWDLSNKVMLKTGSFRGTGSFAPEFHLYAFAIIAGVICIISWIIEKARYSSKRKKTQKVQTYESLRKQAEETNKSSTLATYVPTNGPKVIQGKDHYSMIYTKEKNFYTEKMEPHVYIKYGNIIYKKDGEVMSLCYDYFVTEENTKNHEEAVNEIKKYGLEGEMKNLYIYFRTVDCAWPQNFPPERDKEILGYSLE